MTTFFSKTIGAYVTADEAREEIRDYLKYAGSPKEWPHHRQDARERAANIGAELRQFEASKAATA